MNYKDNRIKMAMANVEQKYNVLNEARAAHSMQSKKPPKLLKACLSKR